MGTPVSARTSLTNEVILNTPWLMLGYVHALHAEIQTLRERIEQLEQLRVLYLGEKIALAVVERHSTGIDTPEQYEAFVERYRKQIAAGRAEK